MSTRIILIDWHVPQHWDYAKKNGFWDLQKRWKGLRTGDTVYFRTTGSGAAFLGRAVVTSDQRELPPGTAHAWSPGDSRRGGYRYRIGLKEFEEIPAVRIPWAEVMAATSAPGRLNPVTLVPEQGVAWLERRLGLDPVDPYERAVEAVRLNSEEEDDIEVLVEDRRVRVPASVVIRRGRRAFREALLAAYEGTCAVTGTQADGVLEAAHISDYRGDHTDKVTNGLLLRADIHTLFDLKLLTILAVDRSIRVAPEILDDMYRGLDGLPAEMPSNPPDHPRSDLLAQHNAACSWLT